MGTEQDLADCDDIVVVPAASLWNIVVLIVSNQARSGPGSNGGVAPHRGPRQARSAVWMRVGSPGPAVELQRTGSTGNPQQEACRPSSGRSALRSV